MPPETGLSINMQADTFGTPVGLTVGDKVGVLVVGEAVGAFDGANVGVAVDGTPVGARDGFAVGALLRTGERLGWTNVFGSQVVPGVQRLDQPSSASCLRPALKSGHHVSCPTEDVPSNTVEVIFVLS
jgi:hypothetical protein